MRMPAVLKDCEEVRDFLMDYLDRKLSRSDSVLFRIHMFICPPCRHYMKRYNSSVALARNILDDPPPPELINLTSDFISKRMKN